MQDMLSSTPSTRARIGMSAEPRVSPTISITMG
jgi:hypothetical protein